MIKFIRSFWRDRRGAFGLITAAAALPLVMMVGLAIDYSFYAQARAQFALAGDAAATYSIREATATYTLQLSSGASNSTAISAATAAGDAAGGKWFTAQLASLPTAYTSGGSPTVNVQANQNLSASNPAGFTSTVDYKGVYPPFFKTLFNNQQNWYVIGTSSANSQYSYVELLVLMDTSSSMLVSADSNDVQTMDDNTVCVPTWELSNPDTNGMWVYQDTPTPFVNWNQVQNISGYQLYSTNSGTTASANCNPGMNGFFNYGQAMAPCAFACHETTKTDNNGYFLDFYGIARRLGVKLKTDVVFSSLETILSSMKSSEQVAGQFTAGIYQFNDNACPIVQGNKGNGDAMYEATSDLSGALTTINNDDYTKNPSETAVPMLSNNGQNYGHTDFPNAVMQLISGKFYCGETTTNSYETAQPGHALANPPTDPTLVGTEPSYPERNIVIVTDGMEDTQPGGSCGRVIGEMAGINAEKIQSPTPCDLGVCYLLKDLGFTVYVLQVTYPTTQNTFYFGTGNPVDQYTKDDFPSLSNGTERNWNEGTDINGNSVMTPSTALPPNAQGLEACASAPQDFKQANNSADIQADMSAMLNSALSAAVRITN